MITNLLGERDERSFTWFGRGWELPLDLFIQQAFNGGQHDPRQITDSFMSVLYRYFVLEVNSRGIAHVHGRVTHNHDLHRSAIEDGAEEIGYEDLEEMIDRRRQRLAGEDAACKADDKSYMGGRRFDGDGSSGPGYSGAVYGGWKRGGHNYTAPART